MVASVFFKEAGSSYTFENLQQYLLKCVWTFVFPTCGVDRHGPSYQHPLMFVVRVLVQGQRVDAAPLNTHRPGRGHSCR